VDSLVPVSDVIAVWNVDFLHESGLGLLLFGGLGIVVGRFLHTCIERLPESRSVLAAPCCPVCQTPGAWRTALPLVGPLTCGRCPSCGDPWGHRALLCELGTGLLFAVYAIAVTRFGSQSIPEGGSIDWMHWRMAWQLILLSLLVVATGIDLRLYIIPDSVTLTGVLCGLAGATLGGNFQPVPLWVDWNDPLVSLYGPYIPEWIKQHSHLHGFAWSLAGLIAGVGLTWTVRIVSRWILGLESLGFGDVTLMAMIGSFLGWQATVMAFLLAPLCGLVLGLALKLTRGRRAVPYGPYLSAGAVAVLLSFRWLWEPTRALFGHPRSMIFLAGISLGGLVGLLLLLRLYRMIPVGGRRTEGDRP
jgi:leader peptidase (prepilin peptidase)/N-methyltransferase